MASYTLSFLQWGVSSYIPFSDQLPGMQAASKHSKKSCKQRIAIAKIMLQDAKEGKLDASLVEKAQHMLAKAEANLKALCPSTKSYMLEQAGKLAQPIGYVSPIAGTILESAYYMGKTEELTQTATQTGFFSFETLKKTSSIAFPLIACATTSLWQPYATASTLIGGAGALLSASLALDMIKA